MLTFVCTSCVMSKESACPAVRKICSIYISIPWTYHCTEVSSQFMNSTTTGSGILLRMDGFSFTHSSVYNFQPMTIINAMLSYYWLVTFQYHLSINGIKGYAHSFPSPPHFIFRRLLWFKLRGTCPWLLTKFYAPAGPRNWFISKPPLITTPHWLLQFSQFF